MILYVLPTSLSLCLLLMIIYLLTANLFKFASYELKTPFECGFDPLSNMRSPMTTRFFILTVLFLIFDVEVVLLFPVLSMVSFMTSPLIIMSIILFMMVLLIGLLYEMYYGVLDWVLN
uniref:NADH-ubiquinone oxidoreductase chain 3 n=1 Tax=Albinaria caerulea TaxID=42349 RepID=NU3M_ALBCA